MSVNGDRTRTSRKKDRRVGRSGGGQVGGVWWVGGLVVKVERKSVVASGSRTDIGVFLTLLFRYPLPLAVSRCRKTSDFC